MQEGGYRRVTNRCMVVWIVTLCTTVMMMLTISGVSRWPRQQQQATGGAGGMAGWLQAAQAHVQALGELGFPPRQSSPSEQTGSPAPASAVGNIFKPPLYPPGFRLSNLDNFTFIINNDVCGDEPVDLVMVVTSDSRKPSVRTAIRDALPSSVLAELRVRRVFLLAELQPPANTSAMYDRRMAALQAENHEHADLVVGHFRDAYRNLTYKHLMGLQWASAYCPQAHYIIKMDHDIVTDIFQLHRRLMTAPAGYRDKNIAIGAVYAGTSPIRDVTNKWYVTKEEFAGENYPSYMSGWLYAITPDAAAKLVSAAARVPFFWVDDAFVTGILRDQAVPELRLIDFGTIWGRKDSTGNSFSPFTMQIGCIYECAAEATASVSQCNTLVGPYWDNQVVMRLFVKHTEYCYRHGCSLRDPMPAVCGGGNQWTARGNMPQAPQDIGDIAS